MHTYTQSDHSPGQMKNSLTFPVGSGMEERDTEGFEPRRVVPKSSREAVRGMGSMEVSISQ